MVDPQGRWTLCQTVARRKGKGVQRPAECVRRIAMNG